MFREPFHEVFTPPNRAIQLKLTQEIDAKADWSTNQRTKKTSTGHGCALGDKIQTVLTELTRAFAEPFTLVDVETGDLIHADYKGLSCDLYDRIGLLSEVSRRGTAEIIEDVAPLTMLAIPLSSLGIGSSLVAVGVFVNQQVTAERELTAAARVFGIDAGRALRWTTGRTVWPPRVLERMGQTVLENLSQRQRLSYLERENAEVEAHNEDIYAELELLHRLTGQLQLAENEQELWQSALSWLADTVPAQCLCIVLRGSTEDDPISGDSTDWKVLTEGECPTDPEELRELLRRFGPSALRQPVLLNRAETSLPTWHCPTVRELACIPIKAGKQPLGWLLALNHRGRTGPEFGKFGSVEIRLLSSVGTILGIHNSNLGLYREQSQLFASSVQALTTAIDAKDGYTSGHSNRVAIFSVSLAKELGLSKADCDTIYLAGLLHDIGKIGVDDQVLNKVGKLSEEEYAQIRLHPQLGHEILRGVRQLDKVLPIVLHHHEAWDGTGYPHGLKEIETPRMARIVAVADAFDAMSSDRPYRQGMPDEELDAIFSAGAGKQWDPEVIKAFFNVRDEFQAILQASTEQTTLEHLDLVS